MTRRHVTVALSGDGGDELFAGYKRYLRDKHRWDRIDAAPRSLRSFGAAGIRTLSPAAWNTLGKIIPEQRRPVQFGEKLHQLARMLDGHSEASAFYKQLLSLWVEPQQLVHGVAELQGPLDDPRIKSLVPDFIERMQYLDILTYLPDDILTKVDRASMAVSLEARVPLLDHRVVEFSWTLPPAMKMQGGVGKRILRRVLHRYVPRELFDRPKMGFAVPLHLWLRHDLRDWAETLLNERKLAADGILNPAPIRARWRELLAGNDDWQSSIWAVLAFQAWKERWLA
jgi:asparagine synthase (glutamine-hydrolysing)